MRWSELSNNQAAWDVAIWNPGSEDHLVVLQCTICNNYAGNSGDGIDNAHYAQVKFSTITQNRCGQHCGDRSNRRAGCGVFSHRNPDRKRNEFLISHSIVAKNIQMGIHGVYAPGCLASVDKSVFIGRQTHWRDLYGQLQIYWAAVARRTWRRVQLKRSTTGYIELP